MQRVQENHRKEGNFVNIAGISADLHHNDHKQIVNWRIRTNIQFKREQPDECVCLQAKRLKSVWFHKLGSLRLFKTRW